MLMREESKKFNYERYKDLLFILIGALFLFLASPPYDFFYLAYIAIFFTFNDNKIKIQWFQKRIFFWIDIQHTDYVLDFIRS